MQIENKKIIIQKSRPICIRMRARGRRRRRKKEDCEESKDQVQSKLV
jgi:hypothetical protein